MSADQAPRYALEKVVDSVLAAALQNLEPGQADLFFGYCGLRLLDITRALGEFSEEWERV